MFAPANQPRFNLTVEGFESDFQVYEFTGKEAINQPFAFELELVSKQRALDLEALLHKPAFLQLSPGDGGIHGQVYRAAQYETGEHLTHYAITLCPRLAYLAHRMNHRIFQHLTVPDIIATLLEEHGILANAYRFECRHAYPKRTYCVQYNESDLHFIQRLCEEEGIHYHFQHSATEHHLVFSDEQSVFPELAPVPYQQDTGMAAEHPVIKRFDVRLETRTGSTARRDYDFENPRLTLESAARGVSEDGLEDYSYPGRFTHRERGMHVAELALERHRSDFQLAEGSSDQPQLVSGHQLPLIRHPRAPWNSQWLLTEVFHEGKQPQVLEAFADEAIPSDKGGLRQGYRNRFRATPGRVPYRPPLKYPKPRILGSQSAVVTGPKGEEIHCDQYGRVKVRFHWDRAATTDDNSSCWLRVSSTWAGAHYGSIAIPRVGMEVLVTFLEGDPDQPLITGCLYHMEYPVPYELPAHRSRSTFKTLSTPGGEGYNELRVEDKQGQEQIFVHAQRDFDINIEHDQRVHVGHERHETVAHNSYSELKAEEHHSVHADRLVEVQAGDHLSVNLDQHIKVGNGQFVEAGREIHLNSGLKMVIEAGAELTLQAGGSFIKIDSGGLTLGGPAINLNSGGSPGQGIGAAPLLPGSVRQAATDEAGQLLLQAQRQALMRAAPRCEICEQAAKEAVSE